MISVRLGVTPIRDVLDVRVDQLTVPTVMQQPWKAPDGAVQYNHSRSLDLQELQHLNSKDMIVITITATSFVQRMVRRSRTPSPCLNCCHCTYPLIYLICILDFCAYEYSNMIA